MQADIIQVAEAHGIDVATADGGQTGLKAMWSLLHLVARDRACDNSHPANVSKVWTRVLPYDGRDYCWFYQGGCNDSHVATALQHIKLSMMESAAVPTAKV